MDTIEQALELSTPSVAAGGGELVVNEDANLPPLTKQEEKEGRSKILNLQLVGIRDRSIDQNLDEQDFCFGLAMMFQGIQPKDAIEEMIALQMVALHNAAIENLRLAGQPNASLAIMPQLIGSANKCSRSFATLLESLHRHRGNAQQKVVVEHVHVHAGGQAIVGNVEGGAGGRGKKSK